MRLSSKAKKIIGLDFVDVLSDRQNRDLLDFSVNFFFYICLEHTFRNTFLAVMLGMVANAKVPQAFPCCLISRDQPLVLPLFLAVTVPLARREI